MRCVHTSGVVLRRTRLALIGALTAAACCCPSPAAAAPLPPQIHTVASGIGQAADVAALPGGGFLYVDSSITGDLVRQVSAKGKATTVAGNGTPFDAPDGTLAVNSG